MRKTNLMLILIICMIVTLGFIGCDVEVADKKESSVKIKTELELEENRIRQTSRILNQTVALTASEEISERRYAAQVLAPLMTSSNTRWRSSSSNTVLPQSEMDITPFY